MPIDRADALLYQRREAYKEYGPDIPWQGCTGPICRRRLNSLEQTGRLKVAGRAAFNVARPAARLKSVFKLETGLAHKSVSLGPRTLARVLQRNAPFR
jgi:hypothetical protein